MEQTLVSWNVNGIRAAEKKGFLKWLADANADIVAVQETKAHPEQLSAELIAPAGYRTFWTSPERKGYSGVAVFSRREPQRVSYGLGQPLFDREGRVIIAEYDSFILFAIYFPNGKMNNERLLFKLDFYREFLGLLQETRQQSKKMLLVCGDLNTAHQEIDLARPKENSTVSGFLPEERVMLDQLVDLGFIDTFRRFHKDPGHYSWWDLKSNARERNVGWRIDYFFVDSASAARVTDAFILDTVQGSDHCPVGIKVKI